MLFLSNYLIRSKSKLRFSKQLLLVILIILFVVVRVVLAGTGNSEQFVRLTGVVTSSPKVSYNSTQFQLQGYFVSLKGAHYEIEESDILSIEGLSKGRFINKASLIALKKDSSPFTILRNRSITILKSTFHEPNSSFLAGILFGESSNIPKSLKDTLISSGTIHLFVASGTNIAVVSGLLFILISRFVKRNWAVLVSILGTWLYASFVGFQAPIVRAALVATVVFSTQYLGLMIRPLTALFWTLTVMLLVYPLWGFDISFYLSGSATLGILTVEPFLYRFISIYIVNWTIIKKELSVSLAAQIAVSPILLLIFHQLSVVGLLSTILVSWIIFPVTIIGFLGLFMYPLSPILSFYTFLLVVPFLNWFLFIVNILS